MSNNRYRWWGYVRNVIRAYPDLMRQYRELRAPKVTADYTPAVSGSSYADPTYCAAVKCLPRTEQKELEAVNSAVCVTRKYPNGKQRLEMIRLVYWEQSYTVVGAGERVGYQEAQAKRLHREFVLLVASYLELA